jgi:hypothetical protein
MSRYDELRREEWYQNFRRYAVVVDLERRELGADLYDVDAFLRLLEDANFRGVCLNDIKFSDRLVEPEFRDFLSRMTWKRRMNAVWKTIGWLMVAAIMGGAGWFLYAQSVAEALPWTREVVSKLTFSIDTGKLRNPVAVSGLGLLVALIVAAAVYGVWTYVTLNRYGFCRKCGKFVFGAHIFNVKCPCAGSIRFLN